MNRLPSVTMLAADTARTKAYVQCMGKSRILPDSVFIMTRSPEELEKQADVYQSEQSRKDYFDLNEPLIHSLRQLHIPYQFIDSDNVNDEAVLQALSNQAAKYIIYSGLGGQILRKPILSLGMRFLHIHPGVVPSFRGSTTVYYSLLTEGRVGATAIFLEEKIDCGPVLHKRWFDIPNPVPDMDYIYDPYIRAVVLTEVLQNYVKNGFFEEETQSEVDGETYYIIHPILKHIAILSINERD